MLNLFKVNITFLFFPSASCLYINLPIAFMINIVSESGVEKLDSKMNEGFSL